MVADEGWQDLRADADVLKGEYGMLLSVGAGRNTPRGIKPSGSSKEIVVSTFRRRLSVHSSGWCTLLEMRQNGLDDIRIGHIRDHPQRATAQWTD